MSSASLVLAGAKPRCLTEERHEYRDHPHRVSGGDGHEHIVSYQWRNPSDGNAGASDRPTLVAWVDRPENHPYVGSGPSRSEAGVVRPQNGHPYLRTYADGQWNNNLLSLPRF